MADTKITALAAIGANPIIPSTFPLPMVDLTDTSMAASGTTKKVTVNQILGAGGTATLASATITGDLTVDTSTLKVDSANNRVGMGTAAPQQTLDVSGTINSTQARFGNVNGRGLTIGTALVSGVNEAGSVFNALGSGSGAHIFQVDSVEQMRLNSTGLGVGTTPAYKLDVLGSGTISGRFKTSGAINALYLEDSGTTANSLYIGTSGNEFRVVTGSNIALAIDVNRNTTVGPATLATTATDGFFYIPGCAGTPTGVPTAKAGRVPFVVDTTNNKLYFYSGGSWVAAN